MFNKITISMNISIFMKGENSNSHILDKNNSCISCTQLLINVVLKSNYFSCSFLKLTTLELILEEKKSIFHQIVCLSMFNGVARRLMKKRGSNAPLTVRIKITLRIQVYIIL